MADGGGARYAGGRVAEAAKGQGRSLRWVARRLGCSVQNVYNIDRARYRPKAAYMESAAALLGLPTGDLFFFSATGGTLIPGGDQSGRRRPAGEAAACRPSDRACPTRTSGSR